MSEYRVPSVVVYSDASSHACGAFTCELDNQIFHRMWVADEKELSSTWRELKAIQACLETFKDKLCGKVVKWFTDSQNCVRIVQSGSSKTSLQNLALSIFSICVYKSISIDIQWIPRELNTQADAISKIFYYDDWGVSKNFFLILWNLYMVLIP